MENCLLFLFDPPATGPSPICGLLPAGQLAVISHHEEEKQFHQPRVNDLYISMVWMFTIHYTLYTTLYSILHTYIHTYMNLKWFPIEIFALFPLHRWTQKILNMCGLKFSFNYSASSRYHCGGLKDIKLLLFPKSPIPCQLDSWLRVQLRIYYLQEGDGGG